MAPRDRARDRGRRWAQVSLGKIAADLRDARLASGVRQAAVAKAAGLSQSQVSRTERAAGMSPRMEDLSMHAAALGLRLSVKSYPVGSPVRDAAQLRLIARLKAIVPADFRWRTEVPVGGHGDLRAWDVVAGDAPGTAIDAETHHHEVQALQRRLELKWRDSGATRVVLLVAHSRHNVSVLREHRAALASTLPLDSGPVLAALTAGQTPHANGLLVL
jgi:transcriptional regulator with XRE-family HTH domain